MEVARKPLQIHPRFSDRRYFGELDGIGVRVIGDHFETVLQVGDTETLCSVELLQRLGFIPAPEYGEMSSCLQPKAGKSRPVFFLIQPFPVIINTNFLF